MGLKCQRARKFAMYSFSKRTRFPYFIYSFKMNALKSPRWYFQMRQPAKKIWCIDSEAPERLAADEQKHEQHHVRRRFWTFQCTESWERGSSVCWSPFPVVSLSSLSNICRTTGETLTLPFEHFLKSSNILGGLVAWIYSWNHSHSSFLLTTPIKLWELMIIGSRESSSPQDKCRFYRDQSHQEVWGAGGGSSGNLLSSLNLDTLRTRILYLLPRRMSRTFIRLRW